MKDCPFCGTDLNEFPEVMTVKPVRTEEYLLAKLEHKQIIGSDAGYEVVCVQCGAIGPRGMSKDEAKANWDRRGKKNPALYPEEPEEPTIGFKADENGLYCVICGSKVGFRHGDRYLLSSSAEGDEAKGICHECLIEHCMQTNCLACDWHKCGSCPHVDTKKIYLEDKFN